MDTQILVIGSTTDKMGRGSKVESIKYDTGTKKYFDTNNQEAEITHEMIMRFFVGAYHNKERFVAQLIRPNLEFLDQMVNDPDPDLDFFDESEAKPVREWLNLAESTFTDYTPFTYKEAWELKSDDLKMAVFGTVDLSEMLEELDGVKYKVDGKKTMNRIFDPQTGKHIGDEENDNVYELWKVKGDKLGMEGEEFHIIKCWCTSTNQEHLIWIDDEFKDDPFAAIAGTFSVHENIIPYIKCLKRQGDVLLVEMKDEYEEKGIKPEGEMVRLTPEQYFGLMVSQA